MIEGKSTHICDQYYPYWYYRSYQFPWEYTRYVSIIHWYLKTRNNLRIKCRFLNSWELSNSIYILLVANLYLVLKYQRMIEMFPCNSYGNYTMLAAPKPAAEYLNWNYMTWRGIGLLFLILKIIEVDSENCFGCTFLNVMRLLAKMKFILFHDDV